MTGHRIDAADAVGLGADLLAHAAVLTHRYGFTQGCFARTSKGDFVSWKRPEACSFCAVGFLLRAAWDLWGVEDWGYDDADRYPYPRSGPTLRAAFRVAARAVEEAVRARTGHDSIVFFNDDPTVRKEDVRALLGFSAEALRTPR